MQHLTIGRGALFALAMLAAGIAAIVGCAGDEEQEVAEQQQVAQVEPQAEVEQPAPVEEPESVEQQAAPEVEPWTLADLPLTGVGSIGNVSWLSERDEFSKEMTIFVGAEGERSGLFEGVLIIGCDPTITARAHINDELIRPLRVVISDIGYVEDDRRSGMMEYVIDGGETKEIAVHFFDSVGGDRNARLGSELQVRAGRDIGTTRFVESLYGASRLAIRLRIYDEVFRTAFDISGLFETPIQPNIERCGEYGENAGAS